MTNNLFFLLLLQVVTTVASFAPNHLSQPFHPCHNYKHNKDHHHHLINPPKRIFSNASILQYSLTVDHDWHTAAQLHPLNNLGVGDDDDEMMMSSFMMMGVTSQRDGISGGAGSSGGAAVAAAASHHHHSKEAAATTTATTGGDDMMLLGEIMEAFLPVIVLILLEVYSQQILQFPLA